MSNSDTELNPGSGTQTEDGGRRRGLSSAVRYMLLLLCLGALSLTSDCGSDPGGGGRPTGPR